MFKPTEELFADALRLLNYPPYIGGAHALRALRAAVCEAAARAADAVTIHLNYAVATKAAAAAVVLSPSLAPSLSSPMPPSDSPPLLV